MPEALQFSELMSNVAAGSEEAVWQLAETYTPYIIRAVRVSLPRNIRQRLDSQDFAQILWTSILLGDTDLTRMKTPEQLIAYLARAAKNKVIDATRHYIGTQKNDMTRERRLEDLRPSDQRGRRNSTPANTPISSDPSPSTYAILRERWAQVITQATQRDQTILQLRLKKYTFQEISQELQVDEWTARRAIQRIIETLSQ
jgi:RNA polymerase sigma factor (sigma-70 family)